ncbi:MAG TPA: aminofutalosine synthase MqnE [Candidatus Sumerlaeota bacterium]|nr:aminofutalosine synthase MqnE [Candidatus Sumerlaeota bacterium]
MASVSEMPAARPIGGFHDPFLETVARRLEAGERLTREDGLRLYESPDLLGVAWLANRERERRHGLKTYYNINRHINYSNICVNHCKFCAFARDPGADGAWEYQLQEIFDKAERDMPPGGDELHIVGGLHPSLPFEYYTEMLRGLKARLPHVHLKAFTAIEIAHLARISGLKVQQVLERLIEAGLGSLPGGGAEVLTANSRKLVCGEKLTGKGWLNIHRIAHQMGLKTNSTMLYGHVESIADRVDHVLLLRELQDETGGFQVFIPLAFHPKFSHMQDLPAPSGATDLRVMAVSRLLLDNIDHLKAYWIMLGVKTAQVAQHFGANDLDGTVVEETIYHMAGAETPQSMSEKELRRLIRETGRVPVRRNTLYEELEAVG